MDIGAAILSMHSIRELLAVKDLQNSIKLFIEFWNSSYFQSCEEL